MQSTARLDHHGARFVLSPRFLLTLIVGVGPITFLAAAIKGKRRP